MSTEHARTAHFFEHHSTLNDCRQFNTAHFRRERSHRSCGRSSGFGCEIGELQGTHYGLSTAIYIETARRLVGCPVSISFMAYLQAPTRLAVVCARDFCPPCSLARHPRNNPRGITA
jgi:hypothetical protein